MKPAKSITLKNYTLDIYKEVKPEPTDYKMFAEVRELPGCVVAGDTERAILKEAPDVIELFIEAQQALRLEAPKQVSVKLKPQLYGLFQQLAESDGIESISTWMRAYIVKHLRKEGVNVPSDIAIAQPR